MTLKLNRRVSPRLFSFEREPHAKVAASSVSDGNHLHGYGMPHDRALCRTTAQQLAKMRGLVVKAPPLKRCIQLNGPAVHIADRCARRVPPVLVDGHRTAGPGQQRIALALQIQSAEQLRNTPFMP